MEEVQAQDQIAQQGPLQSSSFNQSKPKSGGSKWLIIFIALLILGGAGIFFFTKSSNEAIATPTPSFGVMPIEEEPTPEPTKTPEPVKKDEISIEIQNGTGITGEAKLLQDKLKVLGYTDITVGNATSTDNTDTTVTFLKTTSQTVQDEIKKELEKTYKTVNVKTSSTQKADVLVLTGLRTGSAASTSKASATPTSKSSASPVASSSATPKVTATPTP